MIYLVGIWHSIQRKSNLTIEEGRDLDIADPKLRIDLRTILRRWSETCAPLLYAKNFQAVRSAPTRNSVARAVARANHIEHLFCDPDREERRRLYGAHGVQEEIDKYSKLFNPLENEWLRRIQQCWPASLNETVILFICGADHIGTFGQKLNAVDLRFIIQCADLAEFWGLETA